MAEQPKTEVRSADEIADNTIQGAKEHLEDVKQRSNRGLEVGDNDTPSDTEVTAGKIQEARVEAAKEQGVEVEGPVVKLENPKDTYDDPRIQPHDTNAPDAGVTPEGVRIAQ